jgi:uncharacterized protein
VSALPIPVARAIAFALIALAALAALGAAVPYLSGRVTDNAEILSAGARERITTLLKAHEAATTNQVAILTVPSLEGESIEEFAVHVFEAWKLGSKGKDNGVLVVVAPNEHRMRIEVGYGLEGTLTDLAAARIIRDVMTPRFKDGDYDAGVEDGVRAIIARLEGTAAEPSVPSGEPKNSGAAKQEFFEGPDLPITERILFGAFIFGIIGLFTVIGVLTPGVGWFLYVFLIPFWAMFPIIVVGTKGALILLITYVVGYPIAKLILSHTEWYRKAKEDIRTKGSAQIGGFTIGGSSGGSSWSSGGGGGGFSGGGGSSGGGGASGSW